MPTDLPITAIEGIGPATAQRLAEIGVERIVDLFFVADADVHRAVSDMASRDEAEAWRCMAALMEVSTVDGQWAEALVVGGVETVEELAGKGLADLRAIFAAAVDDGRIRRVPDDEELLDIVRGATRIDRGGVAMGTMVDEEGAPVVDATVEVGERSTTTGPNGRFRVAGIRPMARYHLRADIADRAPFVIMDYSVQYDPRVIGGPIITWDPEPAPMLDEFDGDVLPPLAGATTEWRRMQPEELREGDLLHVNDLYASAPDAKVVSIFRAFDAGRLVVRNARVPLDRFANGTAEVGQLVRHRGGVLRAVPGGLSAFEIHRAARRAHRELRELGADAATMEADEAITWFGQALARHHVLAGIAGISVPEHETGIPGAEGASDV